MTKEEISALLKERRRHNQTVMQIETILEDNGIEIEDIPGATRYLYRKRWYKC